MTFTLNHQQNDNYASNHYRDPLFLVCLDVGVVAHEILAVPEATNIRQGPFQVLITILFIMCLSDVPTASLYLVGRRSTEDLLELMNSSYRKQT